VVILASSFSECLREWGAAGGDRIRRWPVVAACRRAC